jgi:hypothetical protein
MAFQVIGQKTITAGLMHHQEGIPRPGVEKHQVGSGMPLR